MERKKKICKTCKKETYLFSKGNCQKCASVLYANKITKVTEKNKQLRKEKRTGFTEFFARHINIIKNENRICQECGAKLFGLTGEVAHILSKSKFPEIAVNDDNILYLCFFGHSCHAEYDSSLSHRYTMNVFSTALEKYKLFKHLIINHSKERDLFEDKLTTN